MIIKLPEYILTCLKQLNSNGYECYVVGGAIRDSLLGRHISDYDLATNATPLDIKNVFTKEAIYDNGIKHGTITVIIKSHPIEITTYRIDGEYFDGRHPESVYYTQSIYEDCKRRDFTINAICYHPKSGFLDFFDGMDDLNNKVIRCIDDPDKRFNEDALRIMRALRFSAQLEFSIEQNTKESIFKNKDLLHKISIERITDEFLKIIKCDNCSKIIQEYFEIFSLFIKELKTLNDYQIEKTVSFLDNHIYSTSTKIATLLYYLKDDALSIMEYLKLPNTTKRKVMYLLEYENVDLTHRLTLKKTLSISEEYFNDLLEFSKIIDPSLNIKEIRTEANYILKNNEPIRLKQLHISGNDVVALGFKGHDISIILNDVLNQIMDGSVLNIKEDMINYINETYKKEA